MAEEKLFASVGFDETRIKNTLKNKPLTDLLVAILHAAGVEKGCDKAIGNRLYDLATKNSKIKSEQATFVAPYIGKEKIKTVAQLEAAIKYVVAAGDAKINPQDFEQHTGVGVVVTAQQIKETVAATIAEKKADLDAKGWGLRGQLTGVLTKEKLKWADPAEVTAEVKHQLEALLGPEGEKKPAPAAAAAAPAPAAHPPAAAAPGHSHLAEGPPVVLKDPATPAASIKLRDVLKHEGHRVKIQAWCYNIREQRKLVFVELRDGTGFLQAVLEGDCAKAFVQKEIRREASVAMSGKLIRPPTANTAKWSGLELHVDYLEVIGHSSVDLEGLLNLESGVDVLFDQRHIALRGERSSHYMYIRSQGMRAFRDHLFSQGYNEVTPPTMVGTLCEGGSEVFQLDYFGQPAYMTQSSQLYLETCIPALGDVFCILPSFRAEKSRTRRHLTEYTHLEAERPFITFEDLLESIESLICDTYKRTLELAGPELLAINPKAAVPKRPFKRVNYTEAIEFCRKHLIYKDEAKKEFFEFGDDIPEGPERKMIEIIGEPTFLCRFPVEMKAFYMKKDPKDPRLTESCDLLVPGVGEIVGGSMRIHDYEELIAAYKREKLDPSPYYWFTDQRKYGTVPHGGYGLGVERFMVWILGEEHIRNVCLYPRYTGRCHP